ncbi:MAG TPA: lysophospholipid acyltransferase family protein [Patescibacteria group bacterium]|nr:lysophospholipid acyltransferase family protein [Patescibacteria group bacterium]
MPQPVSDSASRVNLHYELVYPELSRWRRMQIPAIGWLGTALVGAIGPTLRFEVLGYQHYRQSRDSGRPVISAFWHRSIFPAIWWWRGRKVVVMNTTNFDGQWTRRVIERFGFWTAQGSSSRGGLRGLVVMAKRLAEGHDAAFTIDGPRGPRYVAKPGPVMLARKTGHAIMVFHIGIERGHTFRRSWDLFQIPLPFSRAVMIIAPLIHVLKDAGPEVLEAKQAEMQASLERVRDLAEGWFEMPAAERDQIRRQWQGDAAGA